MRLARQRVLPALCPLVPRCHRLNIAAALEQKAPAFWIKSAPTPAYVNFDPVKMRASHVATARFQAALQVSKNEYSATLNE